MWTTRKTLLEGGLRVGKLNNSESDLNRCCHLRAFIINYDISPNFLTKKRHNWAEKFEYRSRANSLAASVIVAWTWDTKASWLKFDRGETQLGSRSGKQLYVHKMFHVIGTNHTLCVIAIRKLSTGWNIRINTRETW